MKTKNIVLGLATLALVAALCIVVWRRGHPNSSEYAISQVTDNSTQPEEASAQPASPSGTPPSAALPATGVKAASLAIAVLVEESADYAQRLDAARTLPTNYPAADAGSLRAFLLQRSPLDDDQRGHVLKNELLDGLCGLNPPPVWLGDTLIQLYRDRTQNVVVRDYAVQHMATLHEQATAATALTTPTKQALTESLQAALWEAVNERDNSIGGTALLGLTRLSEERDEPDRSRLADEAFRSLYVTGAGELTRISALQVCARLGVGGALPYGVEFAQSGETIPLRVAGIAAMGLLGGKPEQALLKQLVGENNPPLLRSAAHTALARLDERMREEMRQTVKPK